MGFLFMGVMKLGKAKKATFIFLAALVLFIVIGAVLSMMQKTQIEPVMVKANKQGINSKSLKKDEYVTNLKDNTLIKLKVRFEGDEKAQRELNEIWPIVRYSCLAVVRGMDQEDFKEANGLERFKHQVVQKINKELTEGKIKDIYITELVIY